MFSQLRASKFSSKTNCKLVDNLDFKLETFEREQMQIKGQENVFLTPHVKVFLENRVFCKLVDNLDFLQTCFLNSKFSGKTESSEN